MGIKYRGICQTQGNSKKLTKEVAIPTEDEVDNDDD